MTRMACRARAVTLLLTAVLAGGCPSGPDTIWWFTTGTDLIGVSILLDEKGPISVTTSKASRPPDGTLIRLDPKEPTITEQISLDSTVGLDARDSAGALYLAGCTNATLDVDLDVIVIKMEPTGKRIWTTMAEGSDANCARGIVVDERQHVFLSGSFKGTLTLGATTLVSRGQSDLFVAELDSAGQWIWALSAGGPEDDGVGRLAMDGDGEIYISGSFKGTARFGAHSVASRGREDLFVARLTRQRTFAWVTTGGDTGIDSTYAVAIHGDALYIAGGFDERTKVGHTTLSSAGSFDGLVARLDRNGTVVWARSFGGHIADRVNRLVVDRDGYIYISGTFTDTASFGDYDLSSNGGRDAFVAKLEPSGEVLWASGEGGENDEMINGLAVDSTGRSYVTGLSFHEARPGSDTPGLQRRLFLWKLDNAP